MKKTISILTLVFIFLLTGLILAACIDVAAITRWTRIDSHAIMVYKDTNPVALIKIPSCNILAKSVIQFSNDTVCDGDTVTVDGKSCDVSKVDKFLSSKQ